MKAVVKIKVPRLEVIDLIYDKFDPRLLRAKRRTLIYYGKEAFVKAKWTLATDLYLRYYERIPKGAGRKYYLTKKLLVYSALASLNAIPKRRYNEVMRRYRAIV